MHKTPTIRQAVCAWIQYQPSSSLACSDGGEQGGLRVHRFGRTSWRPWSPVSNFLVQTTHTFTLEKYHTNKRLYYTNIETILLTLCIVQLTEVIWMTWQPSSAFSRCMDQPNELDIPRMFRTKPLRPFRGWLVWTPWLLFRRVSCQYSSRVMFQVERWGIGVVALTWMQTAPTTDILP